MNTSATAPPRRVDTAQYGLAAFVGLVGVVVLVDGLGLDPGFADQPVQPYAFSYAIGGALVVLGGLLAVATWRGDVAEPEEGEDVDLSGGLDWATLLQLVAVIVIVIALIGWLGWAIMGAFLFAASARILGSRRLLLDIGVGIAMSLLSWYGFYVGLGIPIPAGILDGVL
ncbi:membrane protein [Aeromicrobium flavum]|uniref:Membrane protein n=1 Tax=Aeromicrobium flavum TaxID=416568 RepID=A0A512HYK7_9ACTN|nr:tripartite tricarboxylate transporter TctB family protein [Aeromicrobium flavum]GEO90539.1 membrane protein [Aeromicrobium flavum]